MAILAGVYAVVGAAESLWLDELHSSWTIAGSFSDIVPRAEAGNQSPLYFWLLFAIHAALQGLGCELALRGLSILAWVAMIWLLAGYALGQSPVRGKHARDAPWASGLACVSLSVWVLADRIQLFYATEARVYELVQLLSLVGWLVVAGLLRSTSRPATGCLLAAWTALSTLQIYLHLTTGLTVTTQWIFLTASAWFQPVPHRLKLRDCLLAGLVLAASCLPAGWAAISVWQRRGQWESFAGDTSLHTGLSLFPLWALLTPIALARVVDRLSRRGPLPAELRDSVDILETAAGLNFFRRLPGHWTMWLAATCGPWLAAWLLAALDIAPLFHRRFVIASAIPLFLLAFDQWLRIRSPMLRVAASLGVTVCLIFSQGTAANWSKGYLVGWQRAEGWREATHWLSSQIAEGDQLYVASGLIEGQGLVLPIEPDMQQYLSFPLSGCYRVHSASGYTPQPIALLNDRLQWPEQFLQSAGASEQDSSTHWIVYRGPVERLAAILSLQDRELPDGEFRLRQLKGFGRVSVAAIETQPGS